MISVLPKKRVFFTTMLLLFFIFAQSSCFSLFQGEVDVNENGSLILRQKDTDVDSSDSWNKLILKYRNFIVGFSGIAALTMLLNFIINFTKLGASSSNPNRRHEIVVSLFFTGISATLLGAVSIVVGLFYNIFL